MRLEDVVDHLSPSSLNLFRKSGRDWGTSYLLKQKFAGAAMIRGRAVEAGWTTWLDDGDFDEAVKLAQTTFAEEMALANLSDYGNEVRHIAPMIGRAIDWGGPLGKVRQAQIKVEYRFPDIPVPVIGFIDVAFDMGDVDLKSTTRLPNHGRASAEHIRQVALYRAARQMVPHTLLYVTDTKHLAVPVTDEDVAAGLAELHTDAQALKTFLSLCPDVETFMACQPGIVMQKSKGADDLSGFVKATS